MLRWRFFEILVLEIRKCHLYSKNCFSRYRFFRESGTWKSNFWSIETFRYLNVKFSIYRYRNGIFYMNFIGIDTTMASFTEFYWYRYHDALSYDLPQRHRWSSFSSSLDFLQYNSEYNSVLQLLWVPSALSPDWHLVSHW